MWHPAGCVYMEVSEKADPDERAWAKLDAGGNLVVDKNTNKVKRHAKCDNPVFEFVPFPSEVPPTPIRDQIVKVSFEPVSGEIKHSFPEEIKVQVYGEVVHTPRSPEEPEKSGWWSRNKRWLIPVALAAGAGGTYLGYRAYKSWNSDDSGIMQSTIVNVR